MEKHQLIIPGEIFDKISESKFSSEIPTRISEGMPGKSSEVPKDFLWEFLRESMEYWIHGFFERITERAPAGTSEGFLEKNLQKCVQGFPEFLKSLRKIVSSASLEEYLRESQENLSNNFRRNSEDISERNA